MNTLYFNKYFFFSLEKKNNEKSDDHGVVSFLKNHLKEEHNKDQNLVHAFEKKIG